MVVCTGALPLSWVICFVVGPLNLSWALKTEYFGLWMKLACVDLHPFAFPHGSLIVRGCILYIVLFLLSAVKSVKGLIIYDWIATSVFFFVFRYAQILSVYYSLRVAFRT